MTFPQIFLSILGVMIITTKAPGIIFPKEFMKAILPIVEDKKMLMLGGFLNSIIGLIIIMTWEYYTDGLFMVLPFLGLITFIGGIIMMWFPEKMYKNIIKPLSKFEENKIRALISISTLVGLFFVYLGWTY